MSIVSEKIFLKNLIKKIDVFEKDLKKRLWIPEWVINSYI